MKITMKKTMMAAAIAAMAMSGAANAATGSTGASGSSLIFSAWDANGSYSIDVGSFLNTYLGADNTPASLASGIGKTENLSNTLPDSGFAYPGAVAGDGTIANIALNGFNLSGTGVMWNLAAADGTGRNRLLVSEAGSGPVGVINSQVGLAKTSFDSYNGTGAALSTTTGTIATSADLWYANSALWGDTLGGSGLSGTANTLSGISSLFAIWQKSTSTALDTITGLNLAGEAAGFANLTAGGQYITAQVLGSGANSYLHIATQVAAVPEADTYAMFLAGLGLMGFIARRRMQA